MRASATSKIASPAQLHASQANNTANKADPASPFALLVNDAAKAAQKPAHHDKSGGNKNESQDNGRQAAHTDSTHQPPPVRHASSGKTNKTEKQAKAEKSGHDETTDVTAQTDTKADAKAETKTDTATGDDSKKDSPSADLQLVDKQTLPPAQGPAPQPAITVTAANDGSGTVRVGAASAAGAPQAVQNNQNGQAAAPSDADADDQLAGATAQAAAQNAGQADATPGAAKTEAKTGAVKTAKPVADAKADSKAAAADSKAADIKADATQAQAQSDKAAAANASDAPPAPKPAPPPVQAAATSNIGAPQANAPSVTQHVQVTQAAPNTAPNLPALAVQIASRSQSGSKQFDIRLDPPELGRVEVRLSIDSTGKASAHLSADQPQTLDLLQKDAPALTRALRDAGLDVSQDGLNFSLRQQSSDGGNAGNGGARGNARNFSLSATTSLEAAAAGAQYRAPADGRLDIRV
ncbi:MAG TPA: flagellar hook-length control protein FliK [Rhizomicrobium sp.]